MMPGMNEMTSLPSADIKTAEAFSDSWNNLPIGSVYTFDQFRDWFEPLSREDVRGKTVVELGCGGGSLMTHVLGWEPTHLTGVDLGSSVEMARRNCSPFPSARWSVVKDDIVTYRGEPADLAFSIGVLHHLKDPEAGVRSLLLNTKPGGRFHGWVYAHEGNAIVRHMVDPIRKVASILPWWFTKYFLATPLVTPFYLYAKCLRLLDFPSALSFLPLYEYAKWISKRDFFFFRHVAFDQLVTPQTTYITKERVINWLEGDKVEPGSTYIIFRNGNSWKFGGRRKAA